MSIPPLLTRRCLSTLARVNVGGESARICKAVNPKGSTSCFSCRVWFAFEPIAKLSKVALRLDGKGDNAGVPRTIATDTSTKGMTQGRAVEGFIRIAKSNVRVDKGLTQPFVRPVDHLWEVVNGILKWRIRFDALPFEEQQSPIADGKSRCCAGDEFEKQRFDFYSRPPIPLKYGGAKEFLVSQRDNLSSHRCGDEDTWILLLQDLYRGGSG